MTTEAALDGIRDHGLRWRHRINLKPLSERIGALNDREGGAVAREELEPLVLGIVAKVRTFANNRASAHPAMADDLERRAEELEDIADCDISEVNHFLGELYDSFDYWRVLAA